MGEFFLNDETYENNNTFFYIENYLENYRPNLDRFFTQRPKYLACLSRSSLSESTEIVKPSKFNDFNCHLLPITMALDFFLLIHSLFILYQLDMLSINPLMLLMYK